MTQYVVVVVAAGEREAEAHLVQPAVQDVARCSGLSIHPSTTSATLVWPRAMFSPYRHHPYPASSTRSPAPSPSGEECAK